MSHHRPLQIALVAALALTACGGGGSSVEPISADGGADSTGDAVAVGDGATTIEYWLWDSAQLPAYEACAEAFTEAQSEVSVNIRQLGWDDYWNGLVTGFVSGDAPDVFTNHLSRYPEFAANDQLLPINDYVEADGVDVTQYFEGLADLWVGQEGNRYGLPKDWDTISVFYNAEYVEEAEITEDDLWNMTWNPEDGGAFEETIAHLTVDANGVRGDEPGFDKDNVEVYGLGLENAGGGGHGQTQWSFLAASTGWTYTDQNPWGSTFNYDDPRFVSTIEWWQSLIDKGYMPPLEEALAGVGFVESFAAGQYALATNGSWQTKAYHDLADVEVGLAPVPAGPTGERASMFNGLADSIWSGTEHPDAAWEWVKFLGSSDCQDLVGEAGVVFPAIPSSLDIAIDTFAEAGIDVEPFTVHVADGTTVLFPITGNAAEVTSILQQTMDAIMSFQSEPAPALERATGQMNELFQ